MWTGNTFTPRLSVSSVGSEALQLYRHPSIAQCPRLSVSSVGSEALQPYPCLHCVTPAISLSVSSVGSEALQRRLSAAGEPITHTFSILSRIGGVATGRVRGNLMRGGPPFSILSRIGGVATWSRAGWSAPGSAFQYPQSDRRRCNIPPPPGGGGPPPAFQYPQSDRRRCNVGRRQAGQSATRLSVSSVGSEALQLFLGRTVFLWLRSLSVSSVGSEALQPPADRLGTPVPEPFSILSRIGGVATCLPTHSAACARYFQYPQSDRRRCNHGRRAGALERPHFQYPQSDRRRCNERLAGGYGWQKSPFSILSRIGGVATISSIRRSLCPPSTFSILSRIGGVATREETDGGKHSGIFQYPQSDRRRCNDQAARRAVRFSPLSVSSVGSEALQRPPGRARPRHARGLSVSSVGSEALQRMRRMQMRPAPPAFQYPQSDRRRCNGRRLR